MMEVELPDGRIVTDVPEGTTKAQIAERFGLEIEPEDQSVFRAVADLPLSATSGALGVAKGVSDLFGADNVVSEGLEDVQDFARGLLSAQSKQDSQEAARIQKEAEGKGVWEEVKAAVKAFSIHPLDATAEGVGSVAPFVAAATLTGGGLPAAAALGVGVQAGIVKDSIHDGVYQDSIDAGTSPDKAKEIADIAQSYAGGNIDQIALGGLLGALDAVTGVERMFVKGLKDKIIKRVIAGALTEAGPEALQGGQERLAANIAAQREGIGDPDIMKGVAGQAAAEGIVGGIIGGGVGVAKGKGLDPDVDPNVPPPAKVTPEDKAVTPTEVPLVEDYIDNQQVKPTAFVPVGEQPVSQELAALQRTQAGPRSVARPPESTETPITIPNIPFPQEASVARPPAAPQMEADYTNTQPTTSLENHPDLLDAAFEGVDPKYTDITGTAETPLSTTEAFAKGFPTQYKKAMTRERFDGYAAIDKIDNNARNTMGIAMSSKYRSLRSKAKKAITKAKSPDEVARVVNKFGQDLNHGVGQGIYSLKGGKKIADVDFKTPPEGDANLQQSIFDVKPGVDNEFETTATQAARNQAFDRAGQAAPVVPVAPDNPVLPSNMQEQLNAARKQVGITEAQATDAAAAQGVQEDQALQRELGKGARVLTAGRLKLMGLEGTIIGERLEGADLDIKEDYLAVIRDLLLALHGTELMPVDAVTYAKDQRFYGFHKKTTKQKAQIEEFLNGMKPSEAEVQIAKQQLEALAPVIEEEIKTEKIAKNKKRQTAAKSKEVTPVLQSTETDTAATTQKKSQPNVQSEKQEQKSKEARPPEDVTPDTSVDTAPVAEPVPISNAQAIENHQTRAAKQRYDTEASNRRTIEQHLITGTPEKGKASGDYEAGSQSLSDLSPENAAVYIKEWEKYKALIPAEVNGKPNPRRSDPKIVKYTNDFLTSLNQTLSEKRAYTEIRKTLNGEEEIEETYPGESVAEVTADEEVDADVMKAELELLAVKKAKAKLARDRVANKKLSARAKTNKQLNFKDQGMEAFLTMDGALNRIIESGNVFEKLLAKRLVPYLKNVQLITADLNDPRTPAFIQETMLGESVGYYSEQENAAGEITKQLFLVRQLDGTNGFNNATFLHEALHAGTLGKIDAFLTESAPLSATDTELIFEMQDIMDRARVSHQFLKEAGKSTPALDSLAEVDAFTDLREFVTYGLTQPVMQQFLASIPGNFNTAEEKHGYFSRLVTAARKLFSMAPHFSNAFLDLVGVTEQLLETPNFSLPPVKAAAARLAPQELDETLALSMRASEINNDPSLNLDEHLLHGWGETASTFSIGAILKVLPTMDVERWAYKYFGEDKAIPRIITKIGKIVDKMLADQNNRTRKVAFIAGKIAEFNKQFKDEVNNFGLLTNRSTLGQINFRKHRTLAAALKLGRDSNDEYIGDTVLNALVEEKKSTVEIQQRREELAEAYVEWDALNETTGGKARILYDALFDSYAENFKEHMQLLEKAILDNKDFTKATKGKILAEINRDFQDAKALEVYFPLERFGDYWFKVEGSKESGRKMEFYTFNSAAKRSRFMQERLAMYVKERGVEYTLEELFEDGDFQRGDALNTREARDKSIGSILSESYGFIQNIKDEAETNAKAGVAKAGVSFKAITAIEDSLYQLYLTGLAENDIRRRFKDRQGYAGFNIDVLRVFSSTQKVTANQLSRLKYAGELRLAIDRGYNLLDVYPDRGQAKLFMREAESRAMHEIKPPKPEGNNLDTWAAYGKKAVFYYMLTSIRSAMAQMTQIPIVGVPYFLAEYGASDTAQVMKTYGNIFKIFSWDNTPQTEKGGVDEHGALDPKWIEPNIANSKYIEELMKTDPEKAEALKANYDWADGGGLFMSTRIMELTQHSAVPTAHYESVFGKGTRIFANYMSGAFHHSEAITRKMMFMSAFELELKRAKASNDFDNTVGVDENGERVPSEAEIEAREKAKEVVEHVLFKYTEHNRPAFMKHPVASVAFQFYTFPIQMASHLTRNFYNSIKGESPEVRKAAATKFFGTLAMTGLFSGVVGLPMYSVIMGAAEGIRDAAGDDDDDARDDPENPLGRVNLDLWMRNTFIPKFFGDGSVLAKAMNLDPESARYLSRMVTMGPISTAFDANIGVSTQLDNMLFRNNVSKETNKAALKEGAYNLTGAFGSLAASIAASFDDFDNGETLRGIEKLSPAFMRGAVKAFRIGTEGLTTSRQGLVIKEAEFYHMGKLAAQTLGLSSTEADEMQKVNFLAKEVLVSLGKDRTKLLNRMNNAIRDEDQDALDEVLEDITRFNYKHGVGPLLITNDTVERSVEGTLQSRNVGDYLEGLGLTKSQIGIGAPLVKSSRTR